MIVEERLTNAERGLMLRLVLAAATTALLGGAAETDTKERDMLLCIASKLSGNPTQVIARREIPDLPPGRG